MADPKGFLTTPRQLPARRPVDLRLLDWREVYQPFPDTAVRKQAGRCMDCGIPFCHNGCPLGNLIPEWNDLVWRGDWRAAAGRLHATNNFPEFTGRLCPAPCETACVVGISAPPGAKEGDPVTIKQVEVEIIDRAFAEGWVRPVPPAGLSGFTVAVIGSGPAGLAAAQQLTRAGHAVTVFERDDAPGGLLRYGIPSFKLEKRHLDRRLEQLRAEGTVFNCAADVGADDLRPAFDAVVLCGGARVARDLPVPGRDLAGIHQAMEFLTDASRHGKSARVSAQGKHVVIIGGGDTGADCLGTAHRQGALSVTQLEIMPRPPASRPAHQPWPAYPMIYRVSSAHEEGGERAYAVSTTGFESAGGERVSGLRLTGVDGFDPVPGTERTLEADLVLLAMGFTGAERDGLLGQLGVEFDARGNVARDASYQTSVPGVFVAGDMGRGQSLIVWAIAEGRSAAAAVDAFLTGEKTLPAPIAPTARPLVLSCHSPGVIKRYGAIPVAVPCWTDCLVRLSPVPSPRSPATAAEYAGYGVPMIMMLTRPQATEAAAAAASQRDAIQANLLDLDGGFGKQLLAGAQLTGVSKQRWDSVEQTLAGLWEIFEAYTAVVDRAGQLAARHLGHRELVELSGLLTGPSVEIVRTARRGIADTGRELVTLTAARTRMDNAFALVRDVTDAAERCWTDVAGRLDEAASALAGLNPMGDQTLAADLAAAAGNLARHRAALNADPLGTDPVMAARLRDACAGLATRAASLAALRSGAAGQIAAIRALAGSCQAARAEAAYQRAVTRIAAVPRVPEAADLTPRVAGLDVLLAAGRWDKLGSELELLEGELTAVISRFHESERTLVSLLSQRDELRGLLDAYKAKAATLGAAEDMSLYRLYDAARAQLWMAPCDLNAASAAVASYQQAVNG